MNAIISLLLAPAVLGGPTDWVAPEYAMWSASNSGPGSPTYDSQNSIIAAAQSSAKSGPWSITYSTVYPPSNDTRDYLSWAPYHWPNCNWCNEDNSRGMQSDPSSNGSPDAPNDSSFGNEFFRQPRRLKRVRRRGDLFVQETSVGAIATASSETPQVPYPTTIPGADAVQSALASLDDPAPTTSPNTDTPAGDSYEKTSVSKPSATKTSKSSCTPSPTTYMAPSATWTTCPYVARDGIVNPDVRSLRPPGAFNSVSEAVIYNAIAYVLTGVSGYSQNVATFIDTFFLDNETGMKPSMNFGQVIRGPGHSGQSGTFAGILDARGMTKVANSILIIRKAKSPDWSDAKDSRMMTWAKAYASWLANSPSGQGAASRPNNHATFYTLQLASVQVLAGDYDGARGTMNNFLKKIFPDQIARSGEQPFEAVRTRPFHYRCFNLEALIALAKLGEMLDLDLWTTRSKYGTTIQDAVDYTMTVNPGKENPLELGPHVAAAAAAYGDPNGKYAAFLGKTDAGYMSKPYWFFDQPKAIRGAKGGQKVWTIESILEEIGFNCPEVFSGSGVTSVELDDGISVTCDELRPFYEIPV